VGSAFRAGVLPVLAAAWLVAAPLVASVRDAFGESTPASSVAAHLLAASGAVVETLAAGIMAQLPTVRLGAATVAVQVALATRAKRQPPTIRVVATPAATVSDAFDAWTSTRFVTARFIAAPAAAVRTAFATGALA